MRRRRGLQRSISIIRDRRHALDRPPGVGPVGRVPPPRQAEQGGAELAVERGAVQRVGAEQVGLGPVEQALRADGDAETAAQVVGERLRAPIGGEIGSSPPAASPTEGSAAEARDDLLQRGQLGDQRVELVARHQDLEGDLVRGFYSFGDPAAADRRGLATVEPRVGAWRRVGLAPVEVDEDGRDLGNRPAATVDVLPEPPLRLDRRAVRDGSRPLDPIASQGRHGRRHLAQLFDAQEQRTRRRACRPIDRAIRRPRRAPARANRSGPARRS